MKRKFQTIIGASAASVLALSALGQETLNPKTDGTESTHQRKMEARAERLNGAAKSSDIIGMEVQDNQNEKLGKVEDLAVDVESGRIVQVILSSGGFLGMGNTLTAVPPGALHHEATDNFLHLNVSQEIFKAAPRFDASKWEEGAQSNRVTEVYSYYGEQPYFVINHDGSWTTDKDGVIAETLPQNMDGTLNADGSRNVDKTRNAETARNVEDNTSTMSTRNADGTWTRVRYPNGGRANSSWSRLGYVQKASKLIGTPVKNLQDEKLGKVENFVVDISSGRIVVVIISSGGFIGMGDELSAVPPTALQFNAEHDTLRLDASKEMLASSPHFKSTEWPDLSRPGYAGGVYRAYRVEPYFATMATTDADNTQRNVRDRDSRTLTPLDQGNSQTDVNITAQIRKEIIADKEMSLNAQNVKVITKNGQVTLRGPVNSAEEKRLIGEIANRIASAANVDNQLEVKLVTSSNN
jgi:sporulation protein YlmC with PRC-barrel domain